MAQRTDKSKIAKKINEVVKPYCNAEWCLLKEMLACTHGEPRLFVQFKCIEHFKYEESERRGKDIGWDSASMEWVAQGYAKDFAEQYNEDLTAEQIYQNILKSRNK